MILFTVSDDQTLSDTSFQIFNSIVAVFFSHKMFYESWFDLLSLK